MAIQDAISCIKNKAINDIIDILDNPSGYCWQEETWESRKLSDIETIINSMKSEIKSAKTKYLKPEVQK